MIETIEPGKRYRTRSGLAKLNATNRKRRLLLFGRDPEWFAENQLDFRLRELPRYGGSAGAELSMIWDGINNRQAAAK